MKQIKERQTKEQKYKELLEKYEEATEKAFKKLADKIQPEVESVCWKWGIDFQSRNNDWWFSVSGYRLDQEILLHIEDHSFHDLLTRHISRGDELGCNLGDIEIDRSKYEWVGISWDKEKETLSVLTFSEFESIDVGKLDQRIHVYGVFSKQVADEIVRDR
jgi:hypothetical protein